MEQAKPVKPARIRGSFPESYDGPRFYRVVDFDRWNNNPVRLFTIADKKLASRLFDETGNRDRRILQSGLIVDEAGKLLPEWQVPVRANIRKGVKSLYPEFYIGDGSPQLISARVQAIFEQLEPGKHIYVPVDAHWHDGGSERYYCFFSPHAVIYHALNPLANGQEPMTYNNGTPGWQVPGWLWDQCDHFGYLQASTVSGWHYLTCENGARVFSEEIVTLLGDVCAHWRH
jgi:hypothetical protein